METRVFASVVIRSEGRILLVEEGRAENSGLLNLPGGHHEAGERLAECAVREALEETSLNVYLNEVVGIYSQARPGGIHSIRYVFNAHAVRGEAAPADDVAAVRWMDIEEAAALPDEAIVSPLVFHRILEDVRRGTAWPLSVLTEF